jgi:hypothetical protein
MTTTAQLNSLKRAVVIAVSGGQDVFVACEGVAAFFLTQQYLKGQLAAGAAMDDIITVRDGALVVDGGLGAYPVAPDYLELLAGRLHAHGWQ